MPELALPDRPDRPARRPRVSAAAIADFFARQRTPIETLPDPTAFVANLTRSVLEILAGAREIEQVARWVEEDAYASLAARAAIALRARAAKGAIAALPSFRIGTARITSPVVGVVEAVTVVHDLARAKAVCLRVEALDGRWRATRVQIL